MPNTLASVLDHTLLQADATRAAVERLCEEAIEHRFHAVCINPAWVPLAAKRLDQYKVRVVSVVGFPLGAALTASKAAEAKLLRGEGADELDMVMNAGALKSGDEALVGRDIEAVVRAAGPKGVVKVILEACLLSDDEKVRACLIAKEAGAHFVRTSTGFGAGGAVIKDVLLMRRTVGTAMGIKAEGGIRDAQMAQAMLDVGATRLGTSRGVSIVAGA